MGLDFYVPNGYKSLDGINLRPSIHISYHQEERRLVEHIQSILGYGSIHQAGSSKGITYSVNSLSGIIDIINLTNGFYRTPKLDKFCQLIDWYNNHPVNPLSLVVLPEDSSLLMSNAWFAGFIEGDGSFSIRFHELRNDTWTTLELVQSRVDKERSIYSHYANYLYSFCIKTRTQTS